MEMVLHMYEDNIGKLLTRYLERAIEERDIRIKELEIEAAAMTRYITVQDDMVDELYEELDAKDMTILSLQIQAAESEDRADNERRGRLQLVMRM